MHPPHHPRNKERLALYSLRLKQVYYSVYIIVDDIIAWIIISRFFLQTPPIIITASSCWIFIKNGLDSPWVDERLIILGTTLLCLQFLHPRSQLSYLFIIIHQLKSSLLFFELFECFACAATTRFFVPSSTNIRPIWIEINASVLSVIHLAVPCSFTLCGSMYKIDGSWVVTFSTAYSIRVEFDEARLSEDGEGSDDSDECVGIFHS